MCVCVCVCVCVSGLTDCRVMYVFADALRAAVLHTQRLCNQAVECIGEFVSLCHETMCALAEEAEHVAATELAAMNAEESRCDVEGVEVFLFDDYETWVRQATDG